MEGLRGMRDGEFGRTGLQHFGGGLAESVGERDAGVWAVDSCAFLQETAAEETYLSAQRPAHVMVKCGGS